MGKIWELNGWRSAVKIKISEKQGADMQHGFFCCYVVRVNNLSCCCIELKCRLIVTKRKKPEASIVPDSR